MIMTIKLKNNKKMRKSSGASLTEEDSIEKCKKQRLNTRNSKNFLGQNQKFSTTKTSGTLQLKVKQKMMTKFQL
jgi:hypothetical protein